MSLKLGVNMYLVFAVNSAAGIAEHMTDLDWQTMPCHNMHHCVTTLPTVSQTYNSFCSEIYNINYTILLLLPVTTSIIHSKSQTHNRVVTLSMTQ